MNWEDYERRYTGLGESSNAFPYLQGEEALVSSPVFQRRRLNLYCGVPVSIFTPFPGIAIPEEKENLIDCLICGMGKVLLAVFLSEQAGSSRESLEGIATLQLSAGDMERGRVDRATDLLERLCAGLRTREDPFQPVPGELRAALAKAQLIRRSWQGHRWVPTEYGRLCRVFRGYLFQENGRIRRTLCCAAWDEPLLRAQTAWDSRVKVRSFDQRMERLRQGLPCDDEYSAALVRRFADMPLSEYLKDFPQELESLQAGIAGPPKTYAEAADGIRRLIQLGEHPDTGRRLMRDLAQPLISGYKQKYHIK